ncbi:M48 family metallopeptidase [soil metagenome]
MLGAYGLKTYIWNNRLKSVLLLLGFPFLLLLICFGFALVIAAFNDPTVGEGIVDAWYLLPGLVPVAVGGALIWFVIAWFANQAIIDAVTGARPADRKAYPRLYNLLENLCISRGITMPALRVIDTTAMNAFASGVRKGRYSVTVTTGLMDALNDAELEAVLAHELTHIENRDVQLLVIAAVFVGVISLVGDLLIRAPRALLWGSSSGNSGGGGGWSGGRSSSRSNSKGGGGGGFIILILIAIAIFLFARVLAIALRFAMSRKREYLADAGSVELTKNADAMISALRKIDGRSEIAAPAQVQEMFLDHPRATGLGGLFSTHPSVDARVANLVKIAGGHDPGPIVIEVPPAADTGAGPATEDMHGEDTPAQPWGATPPAPWDRSSP